MILKSDDMGLYHFILSTNEYNDLLAGKVITKLTASSEYKKAMFKLSFSGTRRNNANKM